ncbi:hypothetical protein ACFYVL_10735 [Streptomyces sp. NPDC004111]|uniref:hypothetical protein n=1 Tax=Streptomyces sp. NPDC004111 TaxID=3364690 RepID=UPI0036758079
MNATHGRPPTKAAATALLVAVLCGTTLTACGTERAGTAGDAKATGIVCPDGSTPDTTSAGAPGEGEDLTSDDIGGTGEDLTSDNTGGAGEDLTSDDIGGTGEDLTSDDGADAGEDLTSDDTGGTGEDLTSEDGGGAGEDLTSDPAASGDGLPEGPSECWGPDAGTGSQSGPPRIDGVPTVGAHRWYGMKGEFTAHVRQTPSKADDALIEGIRMVKIRLPETSKVMEARIASGCGPEQETCDAQAKAFADWRRAKYGDHGHVKVFGGAKTTAETTW